MQNSNKPCALSHKFPTNTANTTNSANFYMNKIEEIKK